MRRETSLFKFNINLFLGQYIISGQMKEKRREGKKAIHKMIHKMMMVRFY